MTLDEWKIEIWNAHPGATFRETGKYGWGRLDVNEKDVPILVPTEGPHYIDAIPTSDSVEGRLGRLLGTYDMKKEEGTIFS